MKRALLALACVMSTISIVAGGGMPAFAQGPAGGNPGRGLCEQAGHTAGASAQQPLPFGGTEPAAAYSNAPQGVVFTAPGSPFSAVNPGECP